MAAAAAASRQFLSAAREGNSAEVRRLLAEASPQQRLDLLRAEDEDWFRFTALHYATFHGRARRVAALLDAVGPEGSAAVSGREVLLARHTHGGFTPLHNAGFFGHVGCAAALLSRSGIGEERREVLLAKDENGKTPLEVADDWSQHAVARFLLAAEAVAAAEAAMTVALERGNISLLHDAIREVSATDDEVMSKVRAIGHIAEAVLEAATREGGLTSLHAAAATPEVAECDDVELAHKTLELLRQLSTAALEAAVASDSSQSFQVATEQTKAAARQRAVQALQLGRQHARL